MRGGSREKKCSSSLKFPCFSSPRSSPFSSTISLASLMKHSNFHARFEMIVISWKLDPPPSGWISIAGSSTVDRELSNSHGMFMKYKETMGHAMKELGISSITRDVMDFAQREYKLLVTDTKLKTYRKRSSTNQNDGRTYTGRIASEDQKVHALERAEELQRDLKAQHPSFIKCMVRSHVSSGFWLGLPRSFCKDNLPLSELRIILEDEKGMEYDVLYLGRKMGLSGGWRGFSIAHNLEDGDVLIFEQSAPARFKVYIIKAIEDEPNDTDGKKETKKRKKSDVGKENMPVSPNQPPTTGTARKAQGGTKRKLN